MEIFYFKMIAKITPLIRLPSTADVFDYFIPPDLEAGIKPGQLVSIPWRSSLERGVILDIVPPPVPRRGLGGGQEGGFRARPIRKIIDLIPVLTPAQLKLIKKFSEYYFCAPGAVARLVVPEMPVRRSGGVERNVGAVDFKIEKSQLAYLNQAAAGIKEASELEIKDISSFIWLVFWFQKQYSSLVILAPTLHTLEAFGSVLIKKFGESLAIIHSGLSRGAFWRAYQKILHSQAKLILATRQGVFLPLPERSCILMFDSGSDDFKQYDQHPRYDARTVVKWAAELTASRLIYTAPTFALWPQAKPIILPQASRVKTQIRLIDLKQTLGQKGFSIISEPALEAISEAENNKKKVVIISLREQGDDKVSVKRIKEVLTAEGKNVNDIIISPPQILESGELSSWRGKISSLIIASIEPLLALPDYRSSERVFYRLKKWQMLCEELLIPEMLLQSYSPDNLAIRAFALGEEEQFVKSELDFRKELGYPPFVELVKLSYKGNDDKEFEKITSELKLNVGIKILGPYIEHRSKRKSLLLKLRDKIEIPLLYSLPSSQWVVDRDPENVL